MYSILLFVSVLCFESISCELKHKNRNWGIFATNDLSMKRRLSEQTSHGEERSTVAYFEARTLLHEWSILRWLHWARLVDCLFSIGSFEDPSDRESKQKCTERNGIVDLLPGVAPTFHYPFGLNLSSLLDIHRSSLSLNGFIFVLIQYDLWLSKHPEMIISSPGYIHHQQLSRHTSIPDGNLLYHSATLINRQLLIWGLQSKKAGILSDIED